MLYAYIDSHTLKLLRLKKTILGQYEIAYFDKKHTVDLLKQGEINNVDLFASAVKEGINALGIAGHEDVLLILPQEGFFFTRLQIPPDYSSSSLEGYVQDKLRGELGTESDDYLYDYLTSELNSHQHVSCFAIKRDIVATFDEAFKLLNLKLVGALPEALTLFTLFTKTLRKEKKENIMYASYNEGEVTGYVYDSSGLLSKKRWVAKVDKEENLDKILKEKVKDLEEKNIKLNRIILSGAKSEGIRQDTFTKKVGVWTNPLKRIIPHFYQDHLKLLMTSPDASFPILTFDSCFGAFVFASENKRFNILKKYSRRRRRGGGVPFFNKKVFGFIFFFLLSFGVSFAVLFALSKTGVISSLKVPSFVKKPEPTITKEPETSPTPRPTIKKESLRIKVLNGSGTKGLASEVKNLLIEKGYEEILTDNADNFDYETTILQVKKSKKDIIDTLKEDLSEGVKSPEVETLDEDDPSDIIIIIGVDYK